MIADLAPTGWSLDDLPQPSKRCGSKHLDCSGWDSSRAYKHGFPSRLIHRAGQRSAAQRLSNEPAGTTGCAPVSTPLLLAGGAE